MNPRVLRILIPLAAAFLLGLVVWSMLIPAKKNNSSSSAANGNAATVAAAPTLQPSSTTMPATAPTATSQATAPATPPIVGLHAVAPGSTNPSSPIATPLGSLDPRVATMQLEMTRSGAAISAIKYSNLWNTAPARRKAELYEKNRAPGTPLDVSKLDETERYVLQTEQPYVLEVNGGPGPIIQVPVMSARAIFVNGAKVALSEPDAWSETRPGIFECSIRDADDAEIARVIRQFTLGADYDISVQQRIQNRSTYPLTIRWQQCGPLQLHAEGYIDNRRFNVGYLPDPKRFPMLVLANDSDLTVERSSAGSRIAKALDRNLPKAERDRSAAMWPNAASTAGKYGLSWIAATNRYFGLVVHPLLSPDSAASPSLDEVVQEIRLSGSEFGFDPKASDAPMFTLIYSPTRTIEPGKETALDFALYAGPLDRHRLASPPYEQLSMVDLILYRMSTCCAFLSWQWLAHLLLSFLSLLHDYVFRDWGLAIIALVCVVRTLLHPITKRSQANMQRLGKQMGSMKPEIEKLQKKYPNDPKKFQQEQMKLMREQGVNPLKMLGCITLFIQTPIWIALWATLYLAYDLRQQPAFYGLFQVFNHWSFFGDLSNPDRFIQFGRSFTLPLGIKFESINLMPLLMAVVFFIQQKYLTPPSTTPLTPEQEQQQKMMKVMTVVMVPLMLYSAPCGLTLYMFTSSCIGIVESKYIRAHVKEMDLNAAGVVREPKKPRGSYARAWSAAIERAKERAREKNQGPERKFKERK